MRVPREEHGELMWEGQVLAVLPPKPTPISLIMDLDLLGKLKQLSQSQLLLEVDLLMMPTPIGEKGERPFFPYMLLLVDSNSGMILGSELLIPERGLEAMWG
nr:hypothetical protein [Chloroflexota bacterium]